MPSYVSIDLLQAALIALLVVAAVSVLLIRGLSGPVQARLRALEAELAVLNNCNIVSSTDASGRIVHVNELFCRISGYTREELLGRNHSLINSGHHQRKFFMDLYRAIATGQPWRGEIRNRAKDGTCFWLDMTILPTLDRHGRVTRYTSVCIDITESKKAEEMLSVLRERHALAMQGSGICLWDRDLMREAANFYGNWGPLLGYAAEEVTLAPGNVWNRYMHPDDLAQVERHIQACSRGEASAFESEARLRHKNGQWISILIRGSVIERDVTGLAMRISGTSIDVTDLKRAEAELIKTRNDAEAASKAKSEFLAMMSHEIRTPLNGVVGFTEMLMDTRLDEEQRSFAATIRDSGKSLLTIIDDILDFSRIEAGHVTVERAHIDAHRIAHDVLTLLRPRAAEKKLQLEVQWPDAVCSNIVADPGRVRQVLLNLVANAIKFTDSGRITIRALDAGEGMLRIEVEDTGIGISPEQLGRLFKKFTQADSSTTRKYGGTGLGLAISKELVERMGGQIGAQGQIGTQGQAGSGSTFWFTLPFAQASEATAMNNVLTLEPQRIRQAVLDSAHPARVLLVEDHAVNRLLATRLLSKLGCEVEIAENGRIACERTEFESYDVVFMDCQMPEMDGFEATSIIRHREAGSDRRVPIVALTANVLNEDRQRCLEAGMDDFIAKPCTSADFARALERWCKPQALPAVGNEK